MGKNKEIRKSKIENEIAIEREAKEQERKSEALREYLSRSGHKMPTTRRDFLASGVITTMGCLATPTLLQLLSSELMASEISDECKPLVLPSRTWMPYIQIYCGGGGALHTAALMRDQNRQLLNSYNTLGLGKTSNFNAVNAMGTVLAQKNGEYISHLTRQMFLEAGPSAVAKTTMVKFAVHSRDDKRARDNLMGLANAVGYKGTLLPNLRGPGNKPKYVERTADSIQGVVHLDGFLDTMAPAGALKEILNNDQKKLGLLRLVKNLNATQRKRLANTASAKALGQLVECASGKNIDVSSVDRSVFDPRVNTSLSSIWRLEGITDPKDDHLLQATVTYNVLSGRAGGGCINAGSFDYHGRQGGRPICDQEDAKAGVTIGRILKTAEAMNKPVFIHVSTDGSVEGNASDETGVWGSDSGVRGSGFFLVFHPQGRIAANDDQIGHFKADSQTVDDNFIGGWRLEKCAKAIFLNYLVLNNRTDLIDQFSTEFSAAERAKLIKFG